MRMPIRYCFLLLIIVGLPVVSCAQNLSPELSEVGIRLDRAFDEYMRGWKRERVTPVYPKENVWIEFWTRCDRSVKISILTHGTNDAASRALREFAQHDASKKKLEGVGDEAFTRGYGHDVVFRRGHLNVFVSAEVSLMVLSVEAAHREEFQRAEKAATSRMIADFVDTVLKCSTAHSGMACL